MADDPNRPTRTDDQPDEGEMVENAMDFIDTENNEGELAIALGHIRRLMEDQGWSYERAVQVYGIRDHPYSTDFWPPTR